MKSKFNFQTSVEFEWNYWMLASLTSRRKEQRQATENEKFHMILLGSGQRKCEIFHKDCASPGIRNILFVFSYFHFASFASSAEKKSFRFCEFIPFELCAFRRIRVSLARNNEIVKRLRWKKSSSNLLFEKNVLCRMASSRTRAIIINSHSTTKQQEFDTRLPDAKRNVESAIEREERESLSHGEIGKRTKNTIRMK